MIPELTQITLAFMPHKATLAGDMIKAVFGITRTMDIIQLAMYVACGMYDVVGLYPKRKIQCDRGCRVVPKTDILARIVNGRVGRLYPYPCPITPLANSDYA